MEATKTAIKKERRINLILGDWIISSTLNTKLDSDVRDNSLLISQNLSDPNYLIRGALGLYSLLVQVGAGS